SDGSQHLTIIDANDPSCRTNINIQPPESCSEQCEITAQITNVFCDDNGTPTDPADDIFTAEIFITGKNTASTWFSSDGRWTGNYDQTQTLGPLSISDGNQHLTLIDANDPNCKTDITIQPPESCSEQCEITAQITNIFCDDNGTPTDPADDIFTAEIFITGKNTASTWFSSDGRWNGNYNQTKTLGPFSISDGSQLPTLIDANDPNCRTDITIQPPQSCSDQCEITAEITNIFCDDNGTPHDPTDDTYTVEIFVNG